MQRIKEKLPAIMFLMTRGVSNILMIYYMTVIILQLNMGLKLKK